MAVPTNTVTEHNVVGTREDLQDVIFNISPTETPFMTACERSSTSQVFHEWQVDSLADPVANAQIEGDDATALAISPTDRIGNYCQISTKAVTVSETSKASDQAGRNDELSYQVSKRGKELKRDMERALVQNQASSAGNASTARTSAGAESWISTNVSAGATGATAGFSGGTVAAPTDGTQRALTKSLLDGVIQSVWTEGGEPSTIMVGPHNRTVVSGFAGISQLQTDASPVSDVTLVGAIDLYKSNFGVLKIQPNRFMRERTALVLDMEYWNVAFLRPLAMKKLADTGDSEKRFMSVEYTLVSKNEKASGKIADLATS